MFEIILLAYLTYRNSLKAKAKGQNVAVWAVYTVLAYLFFLIIGGFIVLFTFCKNQIDLNQFSSMDPKMRDAARLQIEQAFAAKPLHLITIEMFAIGGYLLIRFLLERMPDKKKPEVHWMDKMGEQ